MANGYAKGGAVQDASYAAGGPVLGRTREFLKEPDQFRISGLSQGPGRRCRQAVRQVRAGCWQG
jgi:hypothetical protein